VSTTSLPTSAPASAPSATASNPRWLFGPLSDLLFGCGLLYVLAFAAHSVAGPSLRGVTPGYLLPLLILLLSSPHYGATLLRVYEQRRDRRSYALFSIWITVALAALFAISLPGGLLGSIFLTLYLTWSPWHYSGQNYGLSVMFLGRRGVAMTPLAKRWLHASFQLSFLLAALVMHLEVGSAYSPVEYEGAGVTFLPVGISRSVGDLLLPVVGLAYLASVVGSLALLRRVARWSDLLPTCILMLTQALWFAAPFAVQYWGWQTGLEPLDAQRQLRSYMLMIFVGHAVQYLWVTTYYARAGGAWTGYGRYWLKALAAGTALWTLPAVALGPTGVAGQHGYVNLALLIATFVNLHHFILDGAIWKLRNSRVAGVLIRSGDEEGDAESGGRTWLRPAVWTLAGVGMLAALTGFYVKAIHVPAAINRGDVDTASRALRWAGLLGADEPVLHEKLASRFESRGDRERALHHARARVALSPHGHGFTYLGLLESRAGHDEAARAAFQAALAQGNAREDHVRAGLGNLALRRGDEEAAIEHLGRSHALYPSDVVASQLVQLLTGAEDETLRDPQRALELALASLARGENALRLHSLSQAYAALDRLDESIEAAERARTRAEGEGLHGLVTTIDRQLEALRAQRSG